MASASGTPCRPSADDCDAEEVCDGVGIACPADGVKLAGTVCRPDAGDCDVEEECDGASSACPVDSFESAGTPCADDGEDCTADECDGAGTCDHPAGNAGTECRGMAGDCDVAESCDGIATTCPPDGFVTAGTECRADTGDCDVAEDCSGASAVCPPDGFEPDGTMCDDGSSGTINDMCMTGVCDGTFVAGSLDNFKCYKARDLKQPKFDGEVVSLNDQFADEMGVEVKKPVLICNPTDVNSEGINNAADHLSCHKVKAARLNPRPRVTATDRFGSVDLELKKTFVLCVPSSKSVVP
jgi:hypothetical protein